MTRILEVSNVSKAYGGVKANEDISLSIEQGSIVGLIGPNGSGKTTLFNSIVGSHPIDKGLLNLIMKNCPLSLSIKYQEKDCLELISKPRSTDR